MFAPCRYPTKCVTLSLSAPQGNLIRTPDGRLAILDFGLMTEVGRRCAHRVY